MYSYKIASFLYIIICVISGSCTCQPGFMGDKCESTCPPGTYGRNCKQTCDCNEGNTVSWCDSVTGECKCKDDWNGTYEVFQNLYSYFQSLLFLS